MTARALLWLALVAAAAGQPRERRVYDKERPWKTNNDWQPAMSIRLTRHGMAHIREVLADILSEELGKVAGVNTEMELSPGTTVELTDVHVTHVKPAELTAINLRPENTIVFGFEDMDLGLAGDFLGRRGPWKLPGTFTGTLTGITAAVSTDLVRNRTTNSLQANVSSCKSVISSSNFNIVPTGRLAKFVRPHLPTINQAVGQLMPLALCQIIKTMVEPTGNMLLANTTTLPIKFGAVPTDGGTPQDAFVRKLQDGLIMDNRVTADPRVTEDYIELLMKGEIKYNSSISNRSTPFYPKPLPPLTETDKMLYVTTSDYVFNSLLYHAYQEDNLNVRVTEALLPPNYSNLLKTTCGQQTAMQADAGGGGNLFSKVCVGSLIPSVGENYPDSSTEIRMLPHGVPEFSFLQDRATLDLQGRILILVKEGRKAREVLVTRADSESNVQMSVEESKLKGNVKIDKLVLKVHRSTLVGLQPQNVEQLAPVVKTILGPELSKGLKDGLPLPLMQFLQLYDSDLQMKPGYATLGTNFRINRAKAQKEISKALQNFDPESF